MSFFKSWTCNKGSSCTTTRTVRTIDCNGVETVTTYVNGQPQSTHTTSQYVAAAPSCPQQSNSNAQSQNNNSDSYSDFEQECLDEHNRYRAIHGCPPLTLNRNLCNFSAEWAEHLASRNTLQHRSNLKYGENLFMAGGSVVTGRTAVKAWYDEIKDYRFGSGGFSGATGHFTQVVWKSSTEMGVAVARRGNSTWVVANYNPPGNYAGQFQQNVPPRRN